MNVSGHPANMPCPQCTHPVWVHNASSCLTFACDCEHTVDQLQETR